MTKRNITIGFTVIVSVLLIVFFVMNAESTTLHFFGLATLQMPLFLLLFITLVVGGILGVILQHLFFSRRKH